MITPKLEEMILRGEANFSVWNHALGALGRIPCEDGKITIITAIRWHNFLDLRFTPNSNNSWNSMLANAEYQMRLESDKGTNYYIFRNQLDLVLTDPINHPVDLYANFDPNVYQYLCVQPRPMQSIDCYIPISRVCKIVITRNAFFDQRINTVGVANGIATEKIPPNGIAGQNIIQKANLRGTATSEWYTPPSFEYSGTTNNEARRRENYYHDTLAVLGTDLRTNLATDTPSVTGIPDIIGTCLVSFDLVTINREIANKLQNT